MLAGKDLFAVEQHLRDGLIATEAWSMPSGTPSARSRAGRCIDCSGGIAATLKAVHDVRLARQADQSHVPYKDQAAMAVKIKKAGYKGMKIRVWRPNPMDDVEVCREIKAAVGHRIRADVRPHRAPPDRGGPEGLGLRDRAQGGATRFQEAGRLLAGRAVRA